MKNSVELPDCIVDDEAMKQNKEKLNKSLRSLQASFAALKAMEADLGEIPDNPKSIKKKQLMNTIDKKILGATELPVPMSERNRMLDAWKRMREKVVRLVDNINGFFREYEDAYCHVTGEGAIIILNEEDILRERSTLKVDPLAQEHYALWREVDEAIKNLRRWEKDNDVRKIPLQEIIPKNLNPARFASIWSGGNMVRGNRKEIMAGAMEKLYL